MPLKRAAAALLAFTLLLAGSFSLPVHTIAQGSVEQLRAAKAETDAISNLADDRKRIASAKAFLKKYPGNYWRHLAYRLWLFSAWRTGDKTELQTAADAYIKEYPDSGAAFGSVSRYFYEAHVFPDKGLAYAQKAKQLFERQLGTDGTPQSMRRISDATLRLPAQPSWQPPSERDEFVNYLGSRFNLARYELSGNQRKMALDEVEPVIELDPFGVDEEETLAPFYFVQGQAYESLNDNAHAYAAYLGALVVGDAQNRYAGQAQSRLHDVGDKAGKDAREDALRKQVPPQLAKLPLARFTDVTDAAGLTGIKASRAAWGDVDGDNDADLLLDGSVLLLNNGSNGFADASTQWGLTPGRNAGLFADVDNDGDLDLYTLGLGSRGNRLLRNDGQAFTDVTDNGGNASAEATAAGWVDYDRDGWVDIYVAGLNEVTRILGERGKAGAADVLLHNTGGSLRMVSGPAVGLGARSSAAGAGVACADYDGNGYPDIFVANHDATPSYLWKNTGGVFSDAGALLEPAGAGGRYAASSAGDWGDVDNDGDMDLLVCNWFSDSERASYINSTFDFQQGGSFTDQRAAKGIRGGTALTEPLLADFNNDGNLDLYLTSSGSGARSYLYINDGQGGWHDMTYLAGARLFAGQGSAVADFDRDGDLDLLVCTAGGVHLLRNDTPRQSWLQVRCVGGAGVPPVTAGTTAPPSGLSNRAAIGARVTLTVGSEHFVREIESGKGSGCGNELIAHFGLGARRGRVSLSVRFPSGKEVTRALGNLNDRIEIRETDAGASVEQHRPEQPPAPPTRGFGH